MPCRSSFPMTLSAACEIAYATDQYYRTYDVTPDGQRFVMLRLPPGQGEDDLRLVVVENFFEELGRLVPR